MRFLHATQKLVQMVIPSFLLVRHPSDAKDRTLNRQAVERANETVDRWQAATEMQRALHWEREFWARHGQNDDG